MNKSVVMTIIEVKAMIPMAMKMGVRRLKLMTEKQMPITWNRSIHSKIYKTSLGAPLWILELL